MRIIATITFGIIRFLISLTLDINKRIHKIIMNRISKESTTWLYLPTYNESIFSYQIMNVKNINSSGARYYYKIAGDHVRILLVAEGLHQIAAASGYTNKKLEIVNDRGIGLHEVQRFLEEVNPVIEGVLITDEGLSQHNEQDKEDIILLLEWLGKSPRPESRVIVLSKDFMKEAEFHSISRRFVNFKVITYDLLRIPASIFKEVYEELFGELKSPARQEESHKATVTRDDGEKRRSFLDRFRSKSQEVETVREATDQLTRDLQKISRGISRVVAVTGHRGSGLTSTVVNIASEASKRGLSTIIIDMDTDYRSMNMYFSRFQEQTQRNEEIDASLIRTLARPQDYMTTAFNLKDNLWLTSLGYNFNDRRLLEHFYTSNKLIGLLSVLRNKFNLVILDMPLDLFKTFKDTMIHIDMFGLCVSNNLHSILSTLRNAEVILDREDASYLNAKSKVIVTKYNDRSKFQDSIFTPDKVSQVLSSGLSDHIRYEMGTAGHVPYSYEFDSQIEMDIPVVNTSADYENAYGNMLLRLMEGAK